MGVKDLVDDASSEKEDASSWLDKPKTCYSGNVMCPQCRMRNTEERHYYYSCLNEDCDATTFTLSPTNDTT